MKMKCNNQKDKTIKTIKKNKQRQKGARGTENV